LPQTTDQEHNRNTLTTPSVTATTTMITTTEAVSQAL
jgi:hypothetical protein